MKQNKYNKNWGKNTKVFIIITVLLIILLAILIFFYFNVYSSVENIFKKPVKITVNDECALIFNRVLHQIDTEGGCRIKCSNACKITNMQYSSSEFIPKNDSCNVCNCYCI